MSDFSPLSLALAAAITRIRTILGDPVAPILVLAPSEANGVLLRQQLALATDFVRVEFGSPERLVRALGEGRLPPGLRPEPSGWLQATLRTYVSEHPERLGRYGAVLRQPGWSRALASAVETLEAAGLDADALARAEDGGLAHHAERLVALASILGAVVEQRAVDRLHSLTDLCRVADLSDRRWAGAVILGDRLLAPRVYDVVRAWLAGRPHVELRPDPWVRLAPAPRGLRAAASGEVVDLADPGRTVVLARTPDDVRELTEAVREVCDAVRAGVPLDRIAVVLPDAAQVEVLRGELAHAGVPATWLVGGALAETPAGGYLLQALALAGGGDTALAWYELIRQPGLRLRTIGAEVTQGQGRWRRILARAGAPCRTDHVLRAVADWAIDRDPDDQRAAANLCRVIEALDLDLRTLVAPETQGQHAARWTALLRRWWIPSPDREQLLTVLRGWGGVNLGPTLCLDAAHELISGMLKSTQALSGKLTDTAIRVTSPMGLLGGQFDRVLVTGLVEGRFPRRPSEDPVLPDDLLEGLNAAFGTSMTTSRDAGAFEERRFAAVVSSCIGRLWLSSPATELLEERPLLASGFVLDAASPRLGRRARYSDLASVQVVTGSRARAWAADPERAVGPLEHRIATLTVDWGAGLARLARHTIGRRLLAFHRALDVGGAGPRLDPDALPVRGLDGTPISVRNLAMLVRDPGRYLVTDVLGVFAQATLPGPSDPTDLRFQLDQVREALGAALDAGGDLRSAFLSAWDTQISRWRKHRADVDDAEIRLIRDLAGLRLDTLIASGAVPSGAPVIAQGPVDAWLVTAEGYRVEGNRLTEVRSRMKPTANKFASQAADLVLAGMVTRDIHRLRVCVVGDAAACESALAAEVQELQDRLRATTRAVRAGWWPWAAEHPLRLRAERAYDVTDLPEGQ